MYSNGIAKVDIHGVLEFVRGREDFVELVRRHMGDDCAQLVRELSQEVKAAEERKRRSADEQKAYIEARKKARQMQIVFTTLCKVVGFDFVGTIAFKSLKTGDVFGPEDFKPQNDKMEG